MPQPPLRRPAPARRPLAEKARAAFDKRPDTSREAVSQIVREKARAALQHIESSPLVVVPTVQAFKQYVKDKLSRGEDLEDLLVELRARAKEEADQRRHIVEAGAEIVQLFAVRDRVRRVREEVIQAARAGQIKGSEAWDRVTRILDRPYPFLTWVEQKIGPFTIGLSAQAKVGLAVGVGGGVGISGMRHCLACFFQQASFSIGLTAGGDVGLQLSVAPGRPEPGLSCTIEVGAGGGSKGTAGMSVAFTPIPRQPTLRDSRLFDWKYAGMAISGGTGEGLDLSAAVGLTESRVLPGLVP
jgi:hypothetical protein